MTSPSEPLRVVAALWVRGGRVLLARRLPGGPHGGLWEFPGGKVELGESDAEALEREIFEELGVRVRAGKVAAEVVHSYPHRTIRLVALWCRAAPGAGGEEPRTLGCAEAAWVNPRDFRAYSMPEADVELARRIFGHLSG